MLMLMAHDTVLSQSRLFPTSQLHVSEHNSGHNQYLLCLPGTLCPLGWPCAHHASAVSPTPREALQQIKIGTNAKTISYSSTPYGLQSFPPWRHILFYCTPFYHILCYYFPVVLFSKCEVFDGFGLDRCIGKEQQIQIRCHMHTCCSCPYMNSIVRCTFFISKFPISTCTDKPQLANELPNF